MRRARTAAGSSSTEAIAASASAAIEENKTKGVIESAPCFASLLVQYEPNEISFADLEKELRSLIGSLGSPEEIELDSRLFYLETLYLDPWTKACIEDYSAKITEKEYDPAFVAHELVEIIAPFPGHRGPIAQVVRVQGFDKGQIGDIGKALRFTHRPYSLGRLILLKLTTAGRPVKSPNLSLVSEDPAPQGFGPPHPGSQTFQLNDLTVVDKEIDFRAIVLDIPRKDVGLRGFEHDPFQPQGVDEFRRNVGAPCLDAFRNPLRFHHNHVGSRLEIAPRPQHRPIRVLRPFGLEFRREFDIVRDGQKEATNYFFGVPGQEEELELTFNHDSRTYDLGTGYGHIALAVDDLDETLAELAGQGIEPEREPYRVREGGSRLCFVRDPDGYRVELIGRE